jgi:glycosyltransferase involved in cell wall biosynthesis
LATCIWNYVRLLDRSVFRVHVLACDDGPFAREIRADGWSCDVLGLGPPPLLRRHLGDRVEKIPGARTRLLRWLVQGAARSARYFRRQHIALVHSNYYYGHAVSGLAHPLSGVRCVWHWHGQERRAAILRLAPILRMLTSRFVEVVATSGATRASLRLLAGDRVTVVYNGIALGDPVDRRAELRSLMGVPQSALVVGMVASLNPIKGHLDLITAASHVCRDHPHVHFVLIGGHNAEPLRAYRDRLLAQRDAVGLGGRLHFLGHRSDAAALVSGFDISVLTTLPPGEGFGLAIIEAMAQCVPVIATDVGAPAELIRNGDNGLLVPPGDPPTLARAIARLLSDPAERARLGRAGRADCASRFDLARSVRELERVYLHSLGRPRLAALQVPPRKRTCDEPSADP